MKRLIEFYIGKTDHTWYVAKIYVPFGLERDIAISRAEGKLINILGEEMEAASIERWDEIIAFVGVYHYWSDKQMEEIQCRLKEL